MLSHHHKCIFIHIPKNAGQSIEHVFLNELGLTWENRAPLLLRPNDKPALGPPRLAHLRANEYVKYMYTPQEMFDAYTKFSFVRNPYSRMVSFYRYLKYNQYVDFPTFVKDYLRQKVLKQDYWFVGPQYQYLYSEDEKTCLVDFVGKFEDLQNDFNRVCELMGASAKPVPHVNDSKHAESMPIASVRKRVKDLWAKATNNPIPKYATFEEYYDDDARQIVADIYARDFELFGYKT